ncbi:MAG: hypothetical protein V3V59_04110 [Thermodesulfovibrionales bacterium]
MDKTKLEHDLDKAETRNKFKVANILSFLIFIVIIISIFLMMNMRSTLSTHEERIKGLEKRITALQDDLKKMKTDEKGESK